MCDVDLLPNATNARICTYECTFCSDCVEWLQDVCPNCGGGFAPRPIRPVHEWRSGLSVAKQPPGTTRRSLSYPRDEIAEFSARLAGIAPADR
jgi:hypothetical protein